MNENPNQFNLFHLSNASDVWIYMATAYLGVSVLLFILARFTPYEWSTGQHPDKFETQFTLMNCMWFGKTFHYTTLYIYAEQDFSFL